MRSPEAHQRSRMSTILTASAATALATLPVITPAATAAPSAPTGDPTARVLQLTNAEREKAGCGDLKRNATLDRAAQDYTARMQSTGHFSHYDTNGEWFDQRQRDAGYKNPGGENIAQGQTTADQVVQEWMASPGHRRNILDCSFTNIGLGFGGSDDYWAQEFGR